MFKIAFVLLSLFFVTACPKKEFTPSKTPSAVLQEVRFSALSGWADDDTSELIPAFVRSCEKIMRLKSEYIDSSQIKISTKDYAAVCQKFLAQDISNDRDFRRFIEANFTPYRVTDNGNPSGKFTSYYEAEINASFEKSAKYHYPIYGKPENLVEVNLQDFDATLPKKRILGRVEKQKLIPYHARADIENTAFEAPVLLWGDDNVDIHIMQIQGSAIAKLEGGQTVRVGYADNNGHDFKGVGSVLLSKGAIKPGDANMIKIKKWLRANPELAKKYMQENKRFVFHRLIEAEGAIGALSVPLTAGRSMAVDRRFIPLGSILWLETTASAKHPIKKLVAAQDVGGAIKGVVRGDYFWGSGGDDVLAKAGSMNSVGKYFILIPKGR